MAQDEIKTRLAPNAPWPVFEPPTKKVKEPLLMDRESKYQRLKLKAEQTNKNFEKWLASQEPVRKKK